MYMDNEQSLFLKVFGSHPKLKVMDFLIVSIDLDYSMKEIAEKSGVGYSTLKLFWKDMVKNRIVMPTRTIGNAKLFKVNVNNLVVKEFHEFYWKITKLIAKQKKSKKILLA